MLRHALLIALVGATLGLAATTARADSITFTATGTFYSNSVDASGLDPVITNPYTFDGDLSDVWTFTLNYNVGDYATTAGTSVFGSSATATLSVDDSANGGSLDSWNYSGNYMALSTGSGFTEIDVCTSVYCQSDPNLNNYSVVLDFSGDVAGGLDSPDVSALSGSNLDFMRNFYDSNTYMSGQTELMGTPDSITAQINSSGTPVPEPATWALFATGLLAAIGLEWRRARA